MNRIDFELSRADYDAIKDRTNFSTLKEIDVSPAHYKWALEHPKAPTADMMLGNAFHLAVLEPQRFETEVVEWTGKVRNGKVWDAFAEQNAGRIILTASDYRDCVEMARATVSSKQAAPFLHGGRAEVTLLWSSEIVPGLPVAMKGRLDYLIDGQEPIIVDLKKAADASPDGFGRQIVNLGYAAQAVMYLEGFRAITGRSARYFWAVTEDRGPFVTQVYEATPLVLAAGREDYGRWLANVSLCRIRDEWPGYATDVLPVQLPAWEAKRAEQLLNAENIAAMETANG